MKAVKNNASSHEQSPTKRATAVHNLNAPSLMPICLPISDGGIQRTTACACGGGCPRCINPVAVQAKLKVGQPNDKYEQEADSVAERVMRMPEPQIQPRPT